MLDGQQGPNIWRLNMEEPLHPLFENDYVGTESDLKKLHILFYRIWSLVELKAWNLRAVPIQPEQKHLPSTPAPSTFNDWLIIVYTRHFIIRPEDANSGNLQILRKGLYIGKV